MKTKFLVTAAAALAALAAIPATATAAITVIGNSTARLCYEAAESRLTADRSDLENCDRALAADDLSLADAVATYVNRGILRSKKADLQGALADFDRASALDAEEPEAYLNKALVLALKGNEAGRAVPLFTTALDKKTRRPELAYFGRAAANEELGNLRLAYADYNRALEADPEWALPRAELTRFSIRRR